MSMRSQPHQLNWNGHDLDSLNLIIDSINDMLGELYQQVSTLATTPASTGSSSLPDPVTVAHGGTGAITAAAARAALGLAIGTNVEAQSSELDAVATLASTGLIARTAAATYAARTLTAGAGVASITNGGGVAGNPTIVGITKLATSVTGAQNDYPPGVLGHTIEYWSGASDAAFTGLVGGVAGQFYTLKNTGTKIATFAHQSGSSSAGNKFTNPVTSGVVPVGPKGSVTFQYDGTDWQMVAHNQGTPITPAFAAGVFTGLNSMTWTVDAGDVQTLAYVLDAMRGLLTVFCAVSTTTVGGVLDTQLRVTIPGGFTSALLQVNAGGRVGDNAVETVGLVFVAGAASTLINVMKYTALSAYSASTNNTTVQFTIQIQVN